MWDMEKKISANKPLNYYNYYQNLWDSGNVE